MSLVDVVLAGLPGCAGAVPGEKLADGPTNTSYRVACGGDSLVLRIDKPEARALGLDRESERDVLHALSRASLTEPPLHVDPARGVLLRRFLPGRAWTPADLRSPANLARLAAVLRALHAAPLAARPFDPLGAARRYAEQIDTPAARELLAGAAAAHARVPPAQPALCHNDPVCGNVLETDAGPVLIDWEYAGPGDPFFDLGVVVAHHDIDATGREGFVSAYLGRAAAPADIARLEAQARFYRRLLALWTLRVGA